MNYGVDWCTQPWCYVAETNSCIPAAYDTVFFAGTEYDSIKLSVAACATEDSSIGLQASFIAAIATIIAV